MKNWKNSSKKIMNNRIFIYGTLMKGFKMHRKILLRCNVKYISKGHIKGKLYDLQNYPCVTENKFSETYGELYQMQNVHNIKIIDAYEGFDPSDTRNSLYVRKEVDVSFDNKLIKAWAYFYNKALPKNAIEITSGDYRKYKMKLR